MCTLLGLTGLEQNSGSSAGTAQGSAAIFNVRIIPDLGGRAGNNQRRPIEARPLTQTRQRPASPRAPESPTTRHDIPRCGERTLHRLAPSANGVHLHRHRQSSSHSSPGLSYRKLVTSKAQTPGSLAPGGHPQQVSFPKGTPQCGHLHHPPTYQTQCN